MIVVHNDARTPALPLPMQTLTTWAMTEEQPHDAKVGVLDPYFVSKYCCEHGVELRIGEDNRERRGEETYQKRHRQGKCFILCQMPGLTLFFSSAKVGEPVPIRGSNKGLGLIFSAQNEENTNAYLEANALLHDVSQE